MRQKTLFRLASWGLFFLFCPSMLLSQDQPDWGDWKGAPNFPGIKIRVYCDDKGLESIARASWHFQFQNTYAKKVYLVYQFETVDSTGAPPTFGAPGGTNLDPGEQSSAYQTGLPGSCQSRKEMFIRIVSISDDQGHQTQPRAGASRSGAFGSAGQSPSSSTSARTTASLTAQTRPGQSQASPTTTQPSASGQSRPVQTVADPPTSISGSTWSCHEDQFRHFAGTNSGLSHREWSYAITFYPNGSISAPELNGRWRQNGTTLKWSDTDTVESGEDRSILRGPHGATELWVMTITNSLMQGRRLFLGTAPADEHTDVQCQFKSAASAAPAASVPLTLAGAWQCKGHIGYYTGQSEDFNFVVTFVPDGSWRGDTPPTWWYHSSLRWTQSGDSFTVPLSIKSEAPLSGRFVDATHIQMTHPAGDPHLDPRNGAETEACERVAWAP